MRGKRWGLQITPQVLCSGKGSEQSLIRHAADAPFLFSCTNLQLGSPPIWILILTSFIDHANDQSLSKTSVPFSFFSIASCLLCSTEKSRWICPGVTSFFNSLNHADLWTDSIFHHKHVLKIIFKNFNWFSSSLTCIGWACFSKLLPVFRDALCFTDLTLHRLLKAWPRWN